MSRTKRKDPIDTRRQRADSVFMGEVISTKPTAKETRRAHADGKKHHKPGRAAKQYLSKGAKAKVKRVLAKVIEEPDETPLPREVKSHVWDYN